MIRNFLFRRDSNGLDVMACILGALAMRDFGFAVGVLITCSLTFLAMALDFKWGFK